MTRNDFLTFESYYHHMRMLMLFLDIDEIDMADVIANADHETALCIFSQLECMKMGYTF